MAPVLCHNMFTLLPPAPPWLRAYCPPRTGTVPPGRIPPHDLSHTETPHPSEPLLSCSAASLVLDTGYNKESPLIRTMEVPIKTFSMKWRGKGGKEKRLSEDSLCACQRSVFDRLSLKIFDFQRICIRAARTHFVRTLARISEFLTQSEFGLKMDPAGFRPAGGTLRGLLTRKKAVRGQPFCCFITRNSAPAPPARTPDPPTW